MHHPCTEQSQQHLADFHTPTRPVCCCLSFDSDSDQESDATPMRVDSSDADQGAVPESSEGSSVPESSDFQTVPIDDEH